MSTSATQEGDVELLEVGKQCSASSCHLVDFLPFKCQHCAEPFCGEHFLPTAHACAKYDAAKHDRVAPSCPLCNTPVAVPAGQDPNIRMERHINTGCSVMTGRKANPTNPTCARSKCGKVLFSPIQCGSCKQQFCPQHRFPKDHICAAANAASSKQSPAATAWTSVSNQTGAASAAAIAAMKRAAASANKPTPSTRHQDRSKTTAAATPKPSASSSRPNPFSATERRTILLTTPPRPCHLMTLMMLTTLPTLRPRAAPRNLPLILILQPYPLFRRHFSAWPNPLHQTVSILAANHCNCNISTC
ncbi:hypothetical protein C8Q80DRAFT_406272 [Daedaleopsis nitida]|nr:hypothetical protein C8Q80DRAFT_406272 [Daedaleopsis nitida]